MSGKTAMFLTIKQNSKEGKTLLLWSNCPGEACCTYTVQLNFKFHQILSIYTKSMARSPKSMLII